MAEIGQVSGWGRPSKREVDNPLYHNPKQRRKNVRLEGQGGTVSVMSAIAGTELWNLPKLVELRGTANLDRQEPETLYYLEKVTDIPLVEEVYVEHREGGKRKHWAVLSERDFDVMDDIYNIEQDVLNRFPGTNIQFRVTVQTDSGPSIAFKADKIYTRK